MFVSAATRHGRINPYAFFSPPSALGRENAVSSAEGVQVRPVLRGIRRGDEGDEAHVLGQEDGARNHACTKGKPEVDAT